MHGPRAELISVVMADDASKKLILARRARFMAAALAGVATAATLGGAVEACGGETDGGGQTADAGPQPCLSPPSTNVDAGTDAAPQPCLSPPSKVDAGADADADADAAPQPCLAPLPPDGG